MTRPARPDDVDEICGALPSTELGTTWGDVPTWKVPAGEKGKGFVLYRHPHSTAVDPATGEQYDDLLVIRTSDAADKAALVEDDSTPFFTIVLAAMILGRRCSKRKLFSLIPVVVGVGFA